ncbi:hypothetical protein [Saccharothrix algeriensis]|uniref:Uncharacterized protein n=1 Tax=Saccharothrix algeriensis TaxID=173560 RepID=A0A8T8HWZ7_9PSEU|nr:hypothetical protein [Saccharothrix algeriensis]MBM7814645.1 hypothetical protein [Saccharothrix algeriensis]QTR02937.1 hypothetical protein J7S33_28690 [Saccharothrix algeriensis]
MPDLRRADGPDECRLLRDVVGGWRPALRRRGPAGAGAEVEVEIDQDVLLVAGAEGRVWHLYFALAGSADFFAEALTRAPFDTFVFTNDAGYFELHVPRERVPEHVLDEAGSA